MRSILSLCIATLLASPALAQPRVEAEAFLGSPFGVGMISAPQTEEAENARYYLSGPALYPVFTTGRLRELLGNVLGEEEGPAGRVSVFFLFQGDKPLKLTFYTPKPVTVTVTPRSGRRRQFNRLLEDWWKSYHGSARLAEKEGDHPAYVDVFLTEMLSRRLDLKPPLLSRLQAEEAEETPRPLEMLGTGEQHLTDQLRGIARNEFDRGPAGGPVPREFAWQRPELADAEAEVEPLALHAPPDCFYVRFGSFQNYLWLQRLMKTHGGDLSRLISMRGQDAAISLRTQQQLAVKTTELSEFLGPQVIADMALIGRDFESNEGGSVGLMFQAKNGLLLSVSLSNERKAAVAKMKDLGAKSETIHIAGRDVGFISTPDNRLRSFYAIDGQFHLVTNTRAIVEQFFAVADGAKSLGAGAEFRRARSKARLADDPEIFLFVPSLFFEQLASPHFQIEIRRRARAAADLQVLEMARLVGKQEGLTDVTPPALVRANILPAGFLGRPDAGKPIVQEQTAYDSIRGARGFFLPIADTAVEKATPAEVALCRRQAEFFLEKQPHMSPLFLSLVRKQTETENVERIEFQGELIPAAKKKLAILTSPLGPATTTRIVPGKDDVFLLQASILGGSLAQPDANHSHVFLGLCDAAPLTKLADARLLNMLRFLRSSPGYAGEYPASGYFDLLQLTAVGPADEEGYMALPLGIWRRTINDFSVLAFSKPLLADVTENLQAEEAETSAQLRLTIADLSQTKTGGWLNALAWRRGMQISAANEKLLRKISQQLGVPSEEALPLADRLLGSRIMCPLGGVYEHHAASRIACARWHSNAIPADFGQPAEFRSPLLGWLRGARAEATEIEGRLHLSGEIKMAISPSLREGQTR